MADLQRIHHGNVRLLVLAFCVQGLCGWSVYKGYSYNMERVNYYKTRGKEKKSQKCLGKTHKGGGQLFIGPDIILDVIK